jgi:hypothetical protein
MYIVENSSNGLVWKKVCQSENLTYASGVYDKQMRHLAVGWVQLRRADGEVIKCEQKSLFV